MIAYDPTEWHDLYVAAAGAAAALDGLLFVAASINVKEILASAGLPSLAGRTVALLTGLLLMSIFVLVPGQSMVVLGVEIGVVGLVIMVPTIVSIVRLHFPVQHWAWTLGNLGIGLIATVPMVVAGISIAAGAGGGLYWALAELVLGFAAAIYNAWILLIEILR